MNLLRLTGSYVRRRGLDTLLNVTLLALGVATILVLMLVSQQLRSHLTRDAEGIDAVIGAKGSPLQLVLSSVYHLDAPTGNIPLADARELLRHPAVARGVPLALGDSYRGFPIVGTEPSYLELRGVELDRGKLWNGADELVVGDRVARELGLEIGDELVSTHGLTESGDTHKTHPLRVVGILAPSGTVADRILLTALETVWDVHGQSTGGNLEDDGSGDDVAATKSPPRRPGPPGGLRIPGMPSMPATDPSSRELTALLVTYSSPLAAAIFPPYVAKQTRLQAASPAIETVRLFSLLGVGLDAMRAFGLLLVATAALSLFVTLFTTIRARRFDLAVMRTLGASRGTLLRHVLLEGVLLASAGCGVGLLMGHLAVEALGNWTLQARQLELTGRVWVAEEPLIVLGALALGCLAALLPAILAYRIDIARTLARKR